MDDSAKLDQILADNAFFLKLWIGSTIVLILFDLYLAGRKGR